MARVKGGNVSKNRRRKVLKAAKGYFGSKHRLYKTAQEQLFHSGAYAFRDRKQNKRNFRRLWITRINAACRMNDISYSKFMNGLSIAGIEVNRKMLSEVAIDNASAFTEFVNISKSALKSGKTEIKVEEKKAKKPVEVKKVVEEKTVEKTTKKVEVETKDYTKMNLTELKALAKEQSVKGFSTMKKEELISNLK